MADIERRGGLHVHIILTSGAKPSGHVRQHPAAKQQLVNMREFASSRDLPISVCTFDHTRSVRGLRSFPTLVRSLETYQGAKRGAVVIDDLNRLIRLAAPNVRPDVLIDLGPHGDHLYCLRQGCLFSKITMNQLEAMLLNPDHGKWNFAPARSRLTKEDRQDQTRKAVQASLHSRALTKVARKEQLEEIIALCEADGRSPTPRAIAEEANRRGLLNAWGRPWKADSVKRTIE